MIPNTVEQIERLMLGLSPKGLVQSGWIDSAIDLLPKAAADIRQSEGHIKRLQDALWKVRGYIANCDHEPAIDEIDAALQGLAATYDLPNA